MFFSDLIHCVRDIILVTSVQAKAHKRKNVLLQFLRYSFNLKKFQINITPKHSCSNLLACKLQNDQKSQIMHLKYTKSSPYFIQGGQGSFLIILALAIWSNFQGDIRTDSHYKCTQFHFQNLSGNDVSDSFSKITLDGAFPKHQTKINIIIGKVINVSIPGLDPLLINLFI